MIEHFTSFVYVAMNTFSILVIQSRVKTLVLDEQILYLTKNKEIHLVVLSFLISLCGKNNQTIVKQFTENKSISH